MSSKFKATSTVEDIVSYKGIIDPSNDLDIVSKKELLKYTAHLAMLVKAKDMALTELKDSFDKTEPVPSSTNK